MSHKFYVLLIAIVSFILTVFYPVLATSVTQTSIVSSLATTTQERACRASGTASTSTIEKLITTTAITYGINPKKALQIAWDESRLNPKAKGDYATSTGYTSFGIWQIHNVNEKGLTIEQAEDPVFSTNWAMQQLKEGHCKIWSTCKDLDNVYY